MTSSSRPGGRLSDSMSVTKPASYLRPSCSWISRFSRFSRISVAMGAAYSSSQVQVDAPAGWFVGWWGEHLRQGDLAQRFHHHVVDVPPVGAHAAGLLDAAVARVDAAFGHA